MYYFPVHWEISFGETPILTFHYIRFKELDELAELNIKIGYLPILTFNFAIVL